MMLFYILIHPGHAWFCQDAYRRVDDFELAFRLGDFPDGLVLPGQVHVAFFGQCECRAGISSTLIEDRHMVIDFFYEFPGLLLAPAAINDRSPSSQETQLAVPRGTGVR